MPKGKKKGKGKGKGKKSANKEASSGGKGESWKLLKTYELNCAQTNSQMCPGIRRLLKAAAEEDKVITKFILETVPLEKEGDLPVLCDPFIVSLRQERYKHVKDIHVWDYPMSYENITTVALFLEKPFYIIRLVEMMDCLIDSSAIARFARALVFCNSLTILNLDYNEFGDEGCKSLCAGLDGNFTLLTLSLCYCNLGVESGKYLGHIVSTTALQELYLDGNELQCEGTMELIKLCADQAEIDVYQREEEAKRKAEEETLKAEKEKLHIYEGTGTEDTSASEKDSKGGKMSPGSRKKKKKGKMKKKNKVPAAPPPVGPWIHKLHLADNGIDGYGDSGNIAPIICMRLFKMLIMNSKCLEELDLHDNNIGELGGREVLDGLKYRKEVKLGGVKTRTTHMMTSDTFNSIVKLGSGLKKKGKKKGKKGKKKKK